MSILNEFLLEIVVGKQGTMVGKIPRMTAPNTSERLYRILPWRGRAIKSKGQLVILVGLRVAKENQVEEAQKGDICWDVMSNGLVVIQEDCQLDRKLNHIGRLVEGFEHLENIKKGAGVQLQARKTGLLGE